MQNKRKGIMGDDLKSCSNLVCYCFQDISSNQGQLNEPRSIVDPSTSSKKWRNANSRIPFTVHTYQVTYLIAVDKHIIKRLQCQIGPSTSKYGYPKTSVPGILAAPPWSILASHMLLQWGMLFFVAVADLIISVRSAIGANVTAIIWLSTSKPIWTGQSSPNTQ